MTNLLSIGVVATVIHLITAVVSSFVAGLVALNTALIGQPLDLLADGFTVAITALGPVVGHAFRAIAPLLLLAVVSLAFWAGWRRWRS